MGARGYYRAIPDRQVAGDECRFRGFRRGRWIPPPGILDLCGLAVAPANERRTAGLLARERGRQQLELATLRRDRAAPALCPRDICQLVRGASLVQLGQATPADGSRVGSCRARRGGC